jgi:uncharacterized lipoprotein YajG
MDVSWVRRRLHGHRKDVIAVTIALAVFALAACSESTSTSGGGTPAVVPSASASVIANTAAIGSFPTGTYKSGADKTVTIAFKEDGSLVVAASGSPMANGTFTSSGNKVVVTDGYCILEGHDTATYTWVKHGSLLTLTTTKDGCAPRKATLAKLTLVS